MMEIRSFRDSNTGTAIKAVGQKGTDTGHFYYTAMTWMSDSRHLIASAQMDGDKKCQFVRVDTQTGESTVLVNSGEWAGGIVSPDDNLYYLDGSAIQAMNLKTLDTWTVCTLEHENRFYEPLSVSNDGRTMGVYWHEDGQWMIGAVDVASGKVISACSPKFEKPYEVANHAMINPVYDNLVFYAHEGKTEHISDRLWVFDMETGKTNNIYRQQMLADGTNGEYVGHEMWANNGEGIYLVKYNSSPLKPTGVYYADKWGNGAEFINGDYAYWHAAPSPDGRWIVADTHEQPTKIVLIDLQDKSSKLLCEQPMWWSHPGHPHPAFSPDSLKVTYTFADEDNHLWIGIIEI
ncbi:oligogalacturonate lyase family protein [Paenibacillus radicis (ex Xue et al. 2023)]|uniref:Oligogalacturonate lyase family protein n=1 Tax=Paenibacillus radicis (ex Xue et al. 2023) TaxID=2972489 RepID=A0ABT1YU53_9BACL|nr:oligogalacturonate lyase family protein [Paenibacillus radicis (ex Xue et al. 2023)]MCR8636724.1 oligogalacturonate lyase family protein [Paenibacillus radicis (ex Xue et al. 2023)]